MSEPPGGKRRHLLPILAMAGTVVVAGLWVVGPHLTRDRDFKEGIDSAAVRDAARPACREMRAVVEGDAGFEAQNEAVERMVARIREVGPDVLRRDVPSESWLRDWEALVLARRNAGGPDYEVPQVGGDRISRRMDELVKDMRECQVPPQLMPPR